MDSQGLLVALLAATAACSFAQTGISRPECTEQGGVAARVQTHAICLDEVDRFIGQDGQAAQRALYDLRVKAAHAIADRYLLEGEAARRSTTPETLVTEVTSAVPAVRRLDVTIEQFAYPKAFLISGEVGARYRLTQSLELEARSVALDKFIESLRRQGDFRVVLPEPGLKLMARRSQSIIGSPDSAVPVTLFVDYDSRESVELLRQLSEAVWGPLRSIAFLNVKYYPERLSGAALRKAATSSCVAGMGGFEALHRSLFTSTENAGTALLAAAESLGIPGEQLKTCMDSEATEIEIRKDVAEAKQSGVANAPAAFVGTTQVYAPTVDRVLSMVYAVNLKTSAQLH